MCFFCCCCCCCCCGVLILPGVHQDLLLDPSHELPDPRTAETTRVFTRERRADAHSALREPSGAPDQPCDDVHCDGNSAELRHLCRPKSEDAPRDICPRRRFHDGTLESFAAQFDWTVLFFLPCCSRLVVCRCLAWLVCSVAVVSEWMCSAQ